MIRESLWKSLTVSALELETELKGDRWCDLRAPFCRPFTHLVPCVRSRVEWKPCSAPAVPVVWILLQCDGLWKCWPGDTSGFLAQPGEGRLHVCCAADSIDLLHLCWGEQEPQEHVGQRIYWSLLLQNSSSEVTGLGWCWAWAVSLRSVGLASQCGSLGSCFLLPVSLRVMPHW